MVEIAGGDPIVDWDSPESWNAADAVRALSTFCAQGAAEVPTYDIATSRRTGMHSVSLDGSHLVLAEGIFAQEIVAECRRLGLLADVFLAVLADVLAASGDVQHVTVAEVEPIDRELEVRGGSDAEAENFDVPILGRLDILGLQEEVFHMGDRHVGPPWTCSIARQRGIAVRYI
jgi:hypothetical protein